MSGPTSRLAGHLALVLVSLLAASVGAQESPSHEPGASPIASLSPEASALAVDAQAILAEILAQTAESPEEAAAFARAAEIERTGLAEIDPELPAILAERGQGSGHAGGSWPGGQADPGRDAGGGSWRHGHRRPPGLASGPDPGLLR